MLTSDEKYRISNLLNGDNKMWQKTMDNRILIERKKLKLI